MKVLLLACTMLLSLTAVEAQTTFTDPVVYNDYIVDQQLAVGEAINSMMNSTFLDSAGIWTVFYQSIEMVKRCNVNIKNLHPFEDDTAFLSAAQTLFQYYENTVVNDYPIFIKALYSSNSTEADYEEMNVIILKHNEKEALLDEQFAVAQSAFAAKHGFTFDESVIEDY